MMWLWTLSAYAGIEAPSRAALAQYVDLVLESEDRVYLGVSGDVDTFVDRWPSDRVEVHRFPSDADLAVDVSFELDDVEATCGIAATAKSPSGYEVRLIGSCTGLDLDWDPSGFEPDPPAPPEPPAPPPPEPEPEPAPVERPEPKPAPEPAAAQTKRASVTFARFVVTDREGDVLGEANTEVISHLLTFLRDHDYDVRGLENLVFDKDASSSARLALGATLKEIEVRHSSLESEAELLIEWQLQDRATGDVVYKGSTRGYASDRAEVSRRKIAYRALDASLEALLDRELFDDAFQVSEDVSAEEGELPPVPWTESVAVRACDAPEVTLPKEITKVLPAVVVVRSEEGVGTGVLVSPDGFVLTAAHVVEGASGLRVKTQAGVEIDAKLLRSDRYQDVAVLDLAGGGYPCARTGTDAELGASLMAVGNPLGTGLEFSLSRGIVSGLRSWAGTRFIQTDASINPGFSGGPLLDERGSMVGVISWKIAGEGLEGIGFGVPTDAAMSRLGLEWGESSTADLEPLRGQVGPVEPSTPEALVVDTTPLAPSRIGEVSQRSVHRGGTALQAIGGISTGVGLIAVAGTYGRYSSTDAMYLSEWQTLQGVNTLGWVGVVSGVGSLITGSLLKAASNKK